MVKRGSLEGHDKKGIVEQLAQMGITTSSGSIKRRAVLVAAIMPVMAASKSKAGCG